MLELVGLNGFQENITKITMPVKHEQAYIARHEQIRNKLKEIAKQETERKD